MNKGRLNFVYYGALLYACLILFRVHAEAQPVISYITPDIGTPDFNTYVEIIGPNGSIGNFGTDGIYLNKPGDSIRVECLNPWDSNSIVIGPIVVSAQGRMIATQIFTRSVAEPNSQNWEYLLPQYRIPICVVLHGTLQSNTDTFYIVNPQRAINLDSTGVAGVMPWNFRSRRGAMIVDNMFLTGRSTCTINTADCDVFTPGNQGYLPATILTKGAIIFEPNTLLSIAGNLRTGGPGGGGGGGAYNDNSGYGVATNGGDGYTGGEAGNGMIGGEGSGGDPAIGTDSTAGGESLTGMIGGAEKPGANQWGSQGAGGGSGYPFGTSGQGGYTVSDISWNINGGYGGGSGADESHSYYTGYGGGGGGNATPGISNTSGGGSACGNTTLIPLAGGSGGASGNPFDGEAGYGGGGGGAISIYGKQAVYVWTVNADGAGGGEVVNQLPQNYSGAGGGGSGGGILISSKQVLSIDTLSTKGGNGGTASVPSPIDSLEQYGGAGGAGRVRFDGPLISSPVVQPSNASQYRGPSTDTSEYVPHLFTLTGTGNGHPIDIYIKPVSGNWQLFDSVPARNSPDWSLKINLPGIDTLYFLVAAQRFPNPDTGEYTTEPVAVFSQAAANILQVPPITPHIAAQKIIPFGALVCDSVTQQTIEIYNTGLDSLTINNIQLSNFAWPTLQIISPAVFPITLPYDDSVALTIKFYSPGDTTLNGDTIEIESNDPEAGNNPYLIAVTGSKSTIRFSTSVPFPNILSLGSAACGVTLDSSFTLTSSSSVRTSFFIVHSNPKFSSAPTLSVPADTTQTIPVVFNGASVPGIYLDTLFITDTCGDTKNVILEAVVDSADFAISSIEDTVLCRGDSVTQIAVIHNLSTVAQILHVAGNNPAFTISPDSLVFAPSGYDTVHIAFTASVSGVDSTSISFIDNCGGTQTISANVLVIAPDIRLSPPLDTVVCPFTTVIIPVVVTNNDTLPRNVQFGSACALSQSDTTLAPATTDTLLVTLITDAPGNDTCTVRVTDECGSSQNIPVIATARKLHTFSLSLVDNGIPALLGSGITLYVIATPAGEVDSSFTFTVAHNPSVLQVDSITTHCNSNIQQNSDSATITLAGCPMNSPDTVAVLYCHSLFGAGDTTFVTLENISTPDACDSITGGDFSVSLLSPPCNPGLLIYTSSATTLSEPYPNPANTSVTFTYTVGENNLVRIQIMDALGRDVQTLINSQITPGEYSGALNLQPLSDGIYFLVMHTGATVIKRAVCVMK